MNASPRRPFIAAALALPVLAGLAACMPGDVISPPRALASPALTPFEDCEDLLGYFQEHALEQVSPWGLGGSWGYGWAGDGAETDSAGGDSGGADGGEMASSGAADYSGTNNQEIGVEEPDIVQTDGRIIVTTADNRLIVVDAASGERVGAVELPMRSTQAWYADHHEILLDRQSSRALVLSREYPGGGMQPFEGTYPAFHPQRTLLTSIDLTDPSTPQILGGMRVEGDYRSARMVDGAVRVVLVSLPPGLTQTHPTSGSLTAEQEAEERNRQLITDSTLDDWLPHLQRLDDQGRVITGGTELLSECSEVSRPPEFSGLATMSVLTLDLSSGEPAPDSSVGLVAQGSTVYASTDRLVVATSPWDAWVAFDTMPSGSREQVQTALHSFDITDPDRSDYLASGVVTGHLLNQFSLSETDGMIRVAVTTDATRESDSQSSLVVLREEDGELVETGRVDGLGLTEQIHAVRYLSPELAAVVTFRQTDPLYLLDTSDPNAPEMVGELKIPGYSAYLHPLGDGLLLGIGQDATDEGMTTGLQASLFDISDPNDPQRIDQLTWENHYSEVEWDHRAFTYWGSTGQFFLPTYAWTEKEEWAGVLAPAVDGGELRPGGEIRMSGSEFRGYDQARRAFVIGDDVWVLGWERLHRHDLSSLDQRAVIDLT